jgi:hypothetical protein
MAIEATRRIPADPSSPDPDEAPRGDKVIATGDRRTAGRDSE